MFLTLPRERNTAFPPVLPFNYHPVEKHRSFVPTEGRIILGVSLFSYENLPSNGAFSLFCLFLSTQHSKLAQQALSTVLNPNPVSW